MIQVRQAFAGSILFVPGNFLFVLTEELRECASFVDRQDSYSASLGLKEGGVAL